MSEMVPNHLFQKFMNSAVRYEEPWRRKAEECMKYCDGEQWSPEEEQTILDRNQQPTVINTILPTVDMVCAVAHDRACDIQVVGREGSDGEKATLMTALLKHVLDSSRFDYVKKQMFRDGIRVGRSWAEVVKYTDEIGKDLLKVKLLPFENVYLDPFSREPDASDARFIIKVKWIDRDILRKLYPECEPFVDTVFPEDNDHYSGQEEAAQMNSQDRLDEFYYDAKGHRVRICECYYTMPEKRKVKILNEETGKYEQKEININAVHYVVFSHDIILEGSAKDHSKNVNPAGIDCYPIVPMYCMRDREGRPRGIVNSLIDIQDQINKLNSKFLWTLMSNRLVGESGAFQDAEEAHEEWQKPDGLVLLKDNGLSKVKIDDKYRDLSYMSNHLNFLLATEQRISGVNDSMLGLGGTNERSGIIQSQRISQGAAMQSVILENMYFSQQRIAYVVLRMIGKFYTDYRVVRVTQPNGMSEQYEFNKTETVVDPATGKEQKSMFNKIDDMLFYDVILKKTSPFTTVREKQLEIFSEVLKAGVIPAPIAGKMMLMLSDIPEKEDMIMQLENYYQAQAESMSAQGQVQGAVQ